MPDPTRRTARSEIAETIWRLRESAAMNRQRAADCADEARKAIEHADEQDRLADEHEALLHAAQSVMPPIETPGSTRA